MRQRDGTMGQKALEKIKHGSRIVDSMATGELFFVADIRRASGLDDRSLRQALERLLKNGYVQKNERGQWSVPAIAAE